MGSPRSLPHGTGHGPRFADVDAIVRRWRDLNDELRIIGPRVDAVARYAPAVGMADIHLLTYHGLRAAGSLIRLAGHLALYSLRDEPPVQMYIALQRIWTHREMDLRWGRRRG